MHALVRVPRSLLAGPFAPSRALKGNSINYRSTVAPSAHNSLPDCEVGIDRGPGFRGRRGHGGPRSGLLKEPLHRSSSDWTAGAHA